MCVFPVHRWPNSRCVQWQWGISVWTCIQVGENCQSVEQFRLALGELKTLSLLKVQCVKFGLIRDFDVGEKFDC